MTGSAKNNVSKTIIAPHKATKGCMVLSRTILTLVMAATLFGFGSCNPTPKKPNVLIIVANDIAWGDMGFNGNQLIETPITDELAHNGVIINRFYATPENGATYFELLSGQYAGCTQTNHPFIIPQTNSRLANIFQQNGYQTAYFGKWFNGCQYPHTPKGNGVNYFYGSFSNAFTDNTLINQVSNPTNGVLTDSLVGYINKTNAPFLAVINYATNPENNSTNTNCASKYLAKGLDLETALVYGAIEQIDTNIGKILDELTAKKIRDNTIIIYMGSSGPLFVRYNGGFKGRQGHVDEGSIRVPFFIAYHHKQWVSRRVKASFAATPDILPTLVDICQLTSNKQGTDGISLLNVLKNEPCPNPGRFHFSRFNHKQQYIVGSIRSNDYLLTVQPWDTSLYNILNDPYQKSDLSHIEPQTFTALLTKYTGWADSIAQNPIIAEPIYIGHPAAPFCELIVDNNTLAPTNSVNITKNTRPKGQNYRWQVYSADSGLYQFWANFYPNNEIPLFNLQLSVANTQILFNFDTINNKEQETLIFKHEALDDESKLFQKVEIGSLAINKGEAEICLTYHQQNPKAINLKGLTISKKNNDD
jgi:arylsulfatase A-like enzyme